MSSTTVKIRKHWALSLDENDLRRLHQVITSFTESEASIRIDFYNDTSSESNNVEELINDTNTLSSLIKRINIRSSLYVRNEGIRTAEITYIDENIIPVVSSEATGDVRRTMAFRHEVNNILSKQKKWYSHWYYSDVISLVVCMIASFYTFVLISNYIGLEKINPQYTLPLVLVIGAIYAAVSRLIVLPRMIFNIGASKRRADIRNSISKYIIITILGGLVIGVAGNFLTDMLKEYIPKKN